jgi:hypothetical protein
MRQTIKYFLWIGGLAWGLQSASAFSLLGPVANGGDAWQSTDIGYNPLPATDAAYGFTDTLGIGPKNLNEGYRRNTPVMYYTFDASWEWFGSNGEFAVQQAFDLLNGAMNGYGNTPIYLYAPDHGFLGDTNGGPTVTLSLTNGLDSYSAGLTEFPLNSESENYQANTLELTDVKSFTLAMLAEQLGLADAVRYTWGLHTRYHAGNVPCPVGMEYSVDQRNYDIVPSVLDQVQYSPYVNGELYNYYIYENCQASAISPPDAASLPIPADPLVNNPPVSSSGIGVDFLDYGSFFTGLTRDDAAGLRWLYSTNNYDTPSLAYRESPAAGSTLFNYANPQLLYTSNYNALVAISMTNDLTTLQGLFPGIQFTYVTNYFSNVVSQTTDFVTNYPYGGVAGQGYIGLRTAYTTNIVEFYQYTFDNVVTNKTYPNTTFALQTITVGSPIGSPVGSPFVTNVTYQTFQSNVVSGDYFVITNGACPPNIQQTLQTNVTLVTNTLSAVTNTDGSSVVLNLVSYFTNYVFVVQPCALVTNAAADYQGVGRMQFIRVPDDNYDYQNAQFITPITNDYTMVMITPNGQYVTQKVQRVLTVPDFLFGAQDLAPGPAAPPAEVISSRNVNFNQANIQTGLAGPGTIDPGPNPIIYNKVGTTYLNEYPFMNGPPALGPASFLWASYDGTTNAPVVYPNGTSLVNLAAEQLANMSVNPQFLPDGTNGVPYNVTNVTFSATGRQPPYTWSLAPTSGGLPPGLTLSANGVISGEPASGAPYAVSYPFVVRVADSSTPPYTMDMNYSITIYPNQ